MKILRAELEPLLVNVRYPPNQVLEVGANVMLTVVFCPVARTIGRLTPETLKTGLVKPIPEIVAVAFPELVRTKTCVWACPT